MNNNLVIKLSLVALAATTSAVASAAQCTPYVPNTVTSNVTLGGADATACSYIDGLNPQQGGGATGISNIPAAWGTTGWTGDGYTVSGSVAYNSSPVNTTFSLTNATTGTWSAGGPAGNYDIVVALHTGGGFTYYFFNDFQLTDAATLGTWAQGVLNTNGTQDPKNYSNFNIYFSAGEGGGSVPVPGTLFLLGAGLVGAGLKRKFLA